jgi:formiminotetrahydrofolate cyclodeaminase
MEANSIATRTVEEFIEEVSSQNHAMAGAVIALSAAQVAALGQACLQISLNLSDSMDETIATRIETLVKIKNQLLQWCNRDANAIAEFVALRDAGQELAGQRLLCNAPAQVSQLSIQAAGILKATRVLVNERVKDDLEMSISLLARTARAALLLLDSNLRLWPNLDLLAEFEPILLVLETGIDKLHPRKRIRA